MLLEGCLFGFVFRCACLCELFADVMFVYFVWGVILYLYLRFFIVWDYVYLLLWVITLYCLCCLSFGVYLAMRVCLFGLLGLLVAWVELISDLACMLRVCWLFWFCSRWCDLLDFPCLIMMDISDSLLLILFWVCVPGFVVFGLVVYCWFYCVYELLMVGVCCGVFVACLNAWYWMI